MNSHPLSLVVMREQRGPSGAQREMGGHRRSAMGEERRDRKGPARPDPDVPREMVPAFSMIPLERWNVERSGTSCGKNTKRDDQFLFYKHLIGWWITELILRSTAI